MVVKEYVTPLTISEAYKLYTEDKSNHIIGGGAWMKLTLKKANKLIALDALELDGIKRENGALLIGAMTSLRTIETSPLVRSLYDGILSNALGQIMGMNVRNIATIGGSVMGKYAFSDLLPVLEVMDTTLTFYQHGDVPLMTFLQTPKFERDILLGIKIKEEKGRGFFKKVATTALDFSIVNIACTRKEDTYKMAVGATPYIATQCTRAMDLLNQAKKIDDVLLEQVKNTVLEELKISNNNRASKAYREELISVYVKRGLKQVMKDVS